MKKSTLIAIAAVTVACKQTDAPAATGGGAMAGSGGGGTTTVTAGGSGATASGGGSAVAAAAGGGGSAAAAPAAPAAPAGGTGSGTPAGKPLRETLAVGAGKPLLLALDAKGQLVARTADGSRSTVVLPGPYGDALHEATRDLVWLRRDTGIDVLDLRAPGPATATTVVTAPDKALEKLGEHFREAPHWDANEVVIPLATPCTRAAGLTLYWAKGGAGTSSFSEGIKAVAQDWFTAQAQRATRPVPPALAKKIAKPRKVPKTAGTCHRDVKEDLGHDECGHGLMFGETPAELVIVSANADKCPAKQCRLHNPTNKKFTPVPGLDADDSEERTCGPFLFDATGTTYLVNDKVCSGATCTSVGKQAIGWLDGARVLDAN